MKKLLFLSLLFCLTISCSTEKEEPIHDGGYNYLLNEYNILESGLNIEGATIGIDTTLIFINGQIDKKLWVGCYNKRTKAQLFEWVDNTELDTLFYLNTGFGDYSNFKINSFSLSYPNYANGIVYFILRGLDIEENLIFTDLYIIKDNELLTKQRRYIYPAPNCFFEIIPWYEGIFVKENDDMGSNPKVNYNIYICYSATGDSLFSFTNEKYSLETGEIVRSNNVNVEALNYEECILFVGNSLQNRYFKRYNVRTKENIWIGDVKPLKDIPNNARLDSIIVEKANEIRKYSFYITFLEGNKTKVTSELNIETGELK